MRVERWIAGVLSFVIVGCSHSQAHLSPKDIRPFYNSSATRVEGLRSALKSSPDAPVRVLMLHGMITRDAGYSNNLQKAIADRLHLTRQSETPKPVPIERGYKVYVFDGPQPLDAKTEIPLSEVTRTAWFEGQNERLVVYEVRWAEPRDVIKNRFLACFEVGGVKGAKCEPAGPILPNPDRRALVNGFAKKALMVDGFADATIVLGEIGHVFRDDVRLAMCMVAADLMDPGKATGGRCDFNAIVKRHGVQETNERLRMAPFFAVTHSLGSFLLLDGQIRFAEARAENDRDMIEETAAFQLLDQKTVFMRANQISLLHLARLRVACEESPCTNRLLHGLNDLEKQSAELSQMTTYVAFNDQNDLLGFELQPYFGERGVVGTLVNVSVRNGRWWIPFVLESPAGAHTASDRNPKIINAIVDGFDLP